jgi:hypothetical protein
VRERERKREREARAHALKKTVWRNKKISSRDDERGLSGLA